MTLLFCLLLFSLSLSVSLCSAFEERSQSLCLLYLHSFVMCQAAVQWCLMFGLILLAFGRELLDSSNSSACTRGCILKEFPHCCDIMLNVIQVKLIVLCQAGYNLVNAYVATRTDDICILSSLFYWRLNCLTCELCDFFLFRSDIRSWCVISLRLA